MSSLGLDAAIKEFFRSEGVDVSQVELRHYPDETNALVFVPEGMFSRAIDVAESVEQSLSSVSPGTMVVVRKAKKAAAATDSDEHRPGVHHPRAAELARLITARNRVSEVQPSLSYVKDLASNIAIVSAERHHLVFGRRGAGKSTLLVEARRQVAEAGALSAWVNFQTLRREEPHRIFLRVAREMVASILARLNQQQASSTIIADTSELYDRLGKLSRSEHTDSSAANRVIPEIQYVISRALSFLAQDLYVFVDDFYYVPRQDQPELLDILHSCVRDSRAWLKVASIRHLTRWFVASPPRGLQTGQDADVIDLDVTLQDPARVRRFLTEILQRYATEVGISSLSNTFRSEALDRLVLASGGVPRDFLVLASASIGKARERVNARLVGVQEINQVAGEAAAVKIQELEEDVAANTGLAGRTLDALAILREFCLNERSSTFYGVDFFDKERRAVEYQVFIDLLDLRLIHLIHSSVSDAHEAGRKYEIFMLDLSQFSGSRLKQGLRVLDFKGDEVVARRTRQSGSERRASSSSQVIGILRTAPVFELERLEHLATPVP